MKTRLEAISRKSKREKNHRFGNLYRLLNKEYLREIWYELNSKSAVAIDGISYRSYEKGLESNLVKRVDRLKNNRYRAKYVRRLYIPKRNGKLRPLGIPSIEDKLLQLGVVKILSAIYEHDFMDSSYGYRTGKSARNVVKDLGRELMFNSFHCVVDADIKDFFDNINHKWMIKMLELRINDKSFIRLIKKWLKAGIMEPAGQVAKPTAGTPQGGIVSPVLANIYMHYVLNLWFEKVVKKHCKGKAILYSYADDFICAFERMSDLKRFHAVLGKRLRKFNLELSENKTRIINFQRESGEYFDFLGFEFRWKESRRFPGRSVLWQRSARGKLRIAKQNVKEWCKKMRSKRIDVIFEKLNSKL